ncbi:cellulose biosynthesis cyclic di-GMP-binding regulatory protein BcsB [Paenibacillus qinlingensis]|uniref:cellulose biosynthesis cyclic di-GMP-binding regulatory protein BcsB n=1 Tax=Paenibacillus qinlingensis TaxID=1837343 RepID=UPI00156514B7|nr:cellulose biosynthesis cyclic di-GMP-binding regulatory protein BcsB [Paenibacillus qinlingensis]NQX59145.1 cellulose biosynthesis cyclic di-GMP-binding regulatory protein BcsB [Paenibacillus qinlingensis]
MKKRWLLISTVCLLSLFTAVSSSAWAEELSTTANKQYQTNFADTSLLGGVTYTQQYFQIEDYWNVTSVEVHLDYEISKLLQNERSSVTLSINGVPFHSFRPLIQETKQQQLTVLVPVSYLVKGVNTLTIQGNFETTLPLAVNACLPTATRDNWLQIAKTSRISVNYANTAIQKNIGDFNEHFIGLDTIKEGLNAILVTEGESNLAVLESATYALSGFAKVNPISDKGIPIAAYSADSMKTKQAIILISFYNDLPEEVKSTIPANDLDSKALIKLVTFAGKPTLVVTSTDTALLVKAGRFIGNQSLLSQLDTDTKVVDATTEVESPTVSISRNMTLTETGDKIVGDRHREKAYFISLPGNRSIADASKLSVKYRYAKNLDFDRSMVTLLINDTPIGSKRLSMELADNDHIDIAIPKTLNISGNFTVKVAFDLELKNAGCIENQDQMPWAFVDKDSMLQLNTKDKADMLFNNYPYPFLRDGSYNQLAVVLPKQHDTYVYQTISNIFNLLGRYAQTNTGEVLFYQDNVAASQLKNREIITIGSYQNNQVIRNNNDKLYFKYDKSGTGFVSNEKMSIEANYGTRIGSLQLIDSPYGNGFGLLAVTGSSSEYVYLASKLIGSEGTLWKVFGDGAVTDIDGQINAFRFKKITTTEPSTVLSDVMDRKDLLGFMVAVVLVALLVILSLILLIRKYREKRRDRG